MTASALKKQRVPNEIRRETSTRRVLDSALNLFVTRGYDATSMVDVAQGAGLTKGAVYFYFKDKLSLLQALLERTEAALFDPIFSQMAEGENTATDQIIMLTNWFARVGVNSPELPLLHVLVSLQMNQRNNPVEAQVKKTYERLHNKIAEVVQHGQRSGEFSDETPPQIQAAIFASLIDGLLLEWHRWGDRVDGKQLADGARQFILQGLSARPTV